VSIARRCAFVLAGAIAVVTLHAAPAPPSKRESASMLQKIEIINRKQPRRRTVITENELNAYFQFDAGKDLPVGVVNPAIAIQVGGRLWGRAVVDLDAVRKASPPRSLLDPKNLLMGRVPLTATGVLTTNNGTGQFAVESANIGNLPLPKLLLDEVVSYYTRSESRPGGFTTDDRFPLPAGIREIQVTPGQAVVVQ
jgi:hypothetical protein